MTKKATVTRLIKQLFFEGKNSVQVYLAVSTEFPTYDEKRLRALIAVIKSQYRYK